MSEKVTKKETFEKRLSRLEEIVQKVESGEEPLEKTMALYKEGKELLKGLEQELKEAEAVVNSYRESEIKEVEEK